MPQLQSIGRRKIYAYVRSPVHILNKIIKLNEVEFHGNKVIVEEAKTPARTIYRKNNLIKNSKLLSCKTS